MTFDEQSRIVLNVEEDTYLGELTHDGNIQWSSGDTWINLGTNPGINPGIEIFVFYRVRIRGLKCSKTDFVRF